MFNLGHLAQPGRRPIESSSNDVVQIYLVYVCLVIKLTATLKNHLDHATAHGFVQMVPLEIQPVRCRSCSQVVDEFRAQGDEEMRLNIEAKTWRSSKRKGMP